MTIEIRQLVIRAVVDDGGRSSSGTPHASLSEPRGAASQARPTPETSLELGADERQALVNACVREVLRKLERARER
jgi:hypothetical protein